jgi:tetratricopeptide (TPR) repeat protein
LVCLCTDQAFGTFSIKRENVTTPNPITLAEDGKKEYANNNFKAAATLFAQAAQAYTSMQDELNAAEMKNNQSVALLQAGNAKGALEATDGTETVFQKAGDIKRQGIAVSNRAAALEGLKKWQEALAEYDRAASLFEQVGEGDMHSIVRKAAANINLKRGKIINSQMDVYDSLRLVEKPTFTQRILKFLIRLGLVK